MPPPADESDYFARVSGAKESPRSPKGSGALAGGPPAEPAPYPPPHKGAGSEMQPYAQPPADPPSDNTKPYAQGPVSAPEHHPGDHPIHLEPTSPTAHSASQSLSLQEPEAFHTSIEATNAAVLLIADAVHRQVGHYYTAHQTAPAPPPPP